MDSFIFICWSWLHFEARLDILQQLEVWWIFWCPNSDAPCYAKNHYLLSELPSHNTIFLTTWTSASWNNWFLVHCTAIWWVVSSSLNTLLLSVLLRFLKSESPSALCCSIPRLPKERNEDKVHRHAINFFLLISQSSSSTGQFQSCQHLRETTFYTE